MTRFQHLVYLLLCIFLSCIVLSITTASPDSDSELVAELLSLRSRSTDGVIHLDDRSVSRFITFTNTPRSYYLLIFFDASHLHSKQELHLQDLRREFSLVSSSFITNNADDSTALSKVFFCDIEFSESQSSYGLFGVNSLPHIRLVGPNVKSAKDSEQMEQGDIARMAESMAGFVQSRTKASVGPIHRPPLLSKNQTIFIVAVLLMGAPFLAKKVLSGETLLHDPRIWLCGAVFVYFFSVSGAMHNIIRKMPMFLVDRDDPSKLIFFYQGSAMQLGAEGFAVGFLYTVVALMLAIVTHVLVRVKNVTAQRVIMIVALIISFWAVTKVVFLDNWKTGYGVHAFWPSSWN